MSKSTLALAPKYHLKTNCGNVCNFGCYMITRHFSEGLHVLLCGINIVLFENHSGQNSPWR